MFWNEDRRLGYEVTSLISPTNGTGFPLFLHSIGQHGEEQVFKARSTKAVPQTHGTFAHTKPATLPHCHPHHCPPLYRMIWTRSSTGLSAKHPSPHPTSQFIPDLSQNSSCGSLWGKAQRGTRPGACTSVSLLSEFTAAHTPSAPCSLIGLPHTEQLPIFLHLIVFAFVHISFTSRAQQAMLLSWTSVYKSWRARS